MKRNPNGVCRVATVDRSPGFQPWVERSSASLVPKGRLNRLLTGKTLIAPFLLVLLSLSTPIFAQSLYLRRYQEPELFTYHLSQASVGVYAEGDYDQSSFQNSGSSVTHTHFFVGPSVGLSLDGSIYHPNFMTYMLNVDGAYGWYYDNFRSGAPAGSSVSEAVYIGAFGFSLSILPGKPYNATAYVDHDHIFRNNDFFNRITVDSTRYGVNVGWRVGQWDLNASYFHRDETDSNVFRPSNNNSISFNQEIVMHEDAAAFIARNERDRGGTTFNYNWNQYTRAEFGTVGTGQDNAFSVADIERFGENDRFRLNNLASYFIRDAIFDKNQEFLTDSTLNIDHRDNLNSYYDFSYDRFTMSDFHSDSFTGQAGVSHQLYDSLHSSIFAHGIDFSTSASDISSDTRRLGGGIAEVYTKMLTAEHRLQLGVTLAADHTDQESTTANLVNVHDERHTFSEGGGLGPSFTLNLPKVVPSTIVVTDDQDRQPAYILDMDYRVVQNGARSVIERLFPSNIPTNSTVHVSYTAAGSPSGSYNTLGVFSELRLELWQNFLGLYARVNLSENDAPPDLRIQEVTSYTFGADVNWNWLRAGAEYIIYDSSQSVYRSAQLFQSASFHPDVMSTLGVDFYEGWIDYVNAHRQEEDYRAILRYNRQMTSRWGFNIDAGISYRRGDGIDQVLAAFRPTVKYVYGKLSVEAGYDYEYQLFLNSQEQQSHLFFLRMKRYF